MPNSNTPASDARVALFFLVGPLRTGSSLLSRCIDDHPDAICLCESEINRALFPPHFIQLHFQRMRGHGLTPAEIIALLDRKPHGSVEAWLKWHADVLPLVRERLDKPHAKVLGDKSPDYFAAPAIVETIAPRARLIYSVRDPRAILRSIWRQSDPSEQQKEERWNFLKANIRTWRPHWERPNLLVSRYEDLVRTPEEAMARVYEHLGLAMSTRFLEPFERLHPRRFLWDTAVDWQSGNARAFDTARADICDDDLSEPQLEKVYGDAEITDFMERFDYV